MNGWQGSTLDTFWGPYHVAHNRLNREREVFSDQVTCDFGPGGGKTIVYALAKGRFGREAGGGMEKRS